MGVLTDVVVADRRDARRVLKSDCPSRDFGGLDAKGLDPVKLGTLHAILTGGGYEPGFMSDTLCAGGRDGPWVYEVPADLVQQLATLTPRRRAAVGKEWAATEEFSPEFDDWPAGAVQQVLRELAALCKRAVDEDKAVLVWMCL
jgi:hypothetical protein